MNSEKRIYTNAAKDKILEEGDPASAFLVAGAGGEVPAEYAELYEEYAKATAEAETKAVEQAPENKARAARSSER